MLDSLLSSVDLYIHTNPWLALLAVFVGGLLTASNPCVLAMIPLMVSFVAGRKEDGLGPSRALSYSLAFVLGLSLAFTALGMIASLAGQTFGVVPAVWSWVLAALCLVMGLHMMGVLTIPIPALGGRLQPKTRGASGALLLGLLFGVVSAPCAAPILVVLLAYLAGSGASLLWGGSLLLVYALGHSVLVLVAGTSMGAARKLLESNRGTRLLERLRRGAGAAILLIGLFFAYRGLPASTGEGSSAEPRAAATSARVLLDGGRPLLLDLGMGVCSQCKRMKPVMERAARELGDRVDVHVLDIREQEGERLADELDMRIMPLIVLLDGAGGEIWRHEGFVDFAELAKVVEASVPRRGSTRASNEPAPGP